MNARFYGDWAPIPELSAAQKAEMDAKTQREVNIYRAEMAAKLSAGPIVGGITAKLLGASTLMALGVTGLLGVAVAGWVMLGIRK